MAATNATTRTARVKFDGDARGLTAAAKRAERAMSGVDKKSRVVGGALASVGSAAIRLGPLLLAAFALAAPAAAAAASGIVLAFGGAIAGIGLLAAAQSKQVRKAFARLKDHVVRRMRDISAPFEATLEGIAETARSTFDAFVPALRGAFKKLAPAIGAFATQFGEAFKELRPAIDPLVGAFNALLGQIGPQLKPLFRDISDALKRLAGVVMDNKVEFGLLIGAMMRLIPQGIAFIAKLADGFGAMVRISGPLSAKYVAMFRYMLKVVRYWLDMTLDAFDRLISGAAKAFSWVPGVGPKLRSVNRSFDKWREGLDRTFAKADGTLQMWEDRLNSLPKTLELRGDISDLQSKIARAKERLRSVPKHRRTEIRARIARLRAGVNAAKRALASLPGSRTVTLRMRRITVTKDLYLRGYDTIGGLQRRAHGGDVEAGRSYLVGERGPERVTFGRDGHVTPNHQLDQAPPEVHVFIGEQELRGMVRTEIVRDNRSTRRRALAGAGVGR